ncbi:AMP-binding protein, partial [Salinimicrobium oceani]
MNPQVKNSGEPKRLFDCLSYQLENFPLPDMLAAKEEGEWRKYSTAEVKQKIDQISASLLKMGISGGDGSVEGRDKIGIISQNCPEWMMADMAIQQIGAVSVPVYPNITNA